MSMERFHSVTRRWFERRYGAPTEAQRLGWPAILAGEHTLLAAPTGSGKTLAAFLASLDQLLRLSLAGRLVDQTLVLYLSPLKALSSDVRVNLESPLAELEAEALSQGLLLAPIRVGLRTGDTPPSERAAMVRRPPHILVTTPESLYLLLTSTKGRATLASVKTVIVDEIHALARDKRGSHLALSLERLDALCATPPVRIGLSATQKPMDQIARFLVGVKGLGDGGEPRCQVINAGHARPLDLAIESLPSELSSVCSHEQWAEAHERLRSLIETHRSTLIFVNTRRLAERVAHQLRELMGEEAVAGHHGSMSRATRQSVERRLKEGRVKAIVATASLELGIDVGHVDLVCQIGSPRSIATFLQRVGRAGHALSAIPKGRLFPLTRDDLIEMLALVRSARIGALDAVEIPNGPIDILAQQIVAACAMEEWSEDGLYSLCRSAWPWRDLTREAFADVLDMLSSPIGRRSEAGAHLHRDRIKGTLRARRGAKILATTCGGAIPDAADYRVVNAEDQSTVGTVNEDFAIDSAVGDVFLLGNTSWRILAVRGAEVLVADAQGAPATIPFWIGEGPGRTVELSAEVGALRSEIARRVDVCAGQTLGPGLDDAIIERAVEFLRDECGADRWAASQAARYVAAQKCAMGLVPTPGQIVFERFFDETGGMQLVIHSCWGARINRAWGFALRKRFCRSFDFELQGSADNNGIVLSLGPQHSFPIEHLFSMLTPENGEHLLTQALLAVPLFRVRWRWNATRSLMVLRHRRGKRVPPAMQRFRADDYLTTVFPMQTACFEHRPEDMPIPDHPLVRQTVIDCLQEATDLGRWLDLLGKAREGTVEFLARDTREPSPFSHELLNANPYAFLDDAPLEERRARAVATRRTLVGAPLDDLGRLDPQAIDRVRREAWPLARNADELHDALVQMVVLPAHEGEGWARLMDELVVDGRAARLITPSVSLWIAVESLPIVRVVYLEGAIAPPLSLPPSCDRAWSESDGVAAILRGRLDVIGPRTAHQLATELGIAPEHVAIALATLEGEGFVLQGRYSSSAPASENEWCERRLLARIHRLTLDSARRAVQPVEPAVFLHFLLEHHGLTPGRRREGISGLRASLCQLEGFEAPVGVWESDLLPSRIKSYQSHWIDELTLTGEMGWGRLQPPRREDERRTARGPSLTRVAPIGLFSRENLAWLLPRSSEERSLVPDQMSKEAAQVHELLVHRGALFAHDLAALLGWPGRLVEEGLSELAALGLVSSDGFAGIRAMTSRGARPRAPRRASIGKAAARGGRWALFPSARAPVDSHERCQRWANKLLERYGVMFRDLLEREELAPSWLELAALYRRMEARGEIRGGRFVAGVSGEQFALPGVVERLRALRDEPPSADVHIVAASDPANLIGIIGDGHKLPAIRGNRLAIRGGKVIAVIQSKQVRFLEALSPAIAEETHRALHCSALARGGSQAISQTSKEAPKTSNIPA